jgi:NTP pyrophosphatase (non-canonical NTP hydrolase)
MKGLNAMAREIRADNERWWTDPATGKPLVRNKGEMLMLMVSEIAEAMEGERKDLMDDHLPNRPSAEVELADLFIRLMDYCGGFGYDIEGAILEKRAFNKTRADHSNAARLAPGGKKF